MLLPLQESFHVVPCQMPLKVQVNEVFVVTSVIGVNDTRKEVKAAC